MLTAFGLQLILSSAENRSGETVKAVDEHEKRALENADRFEVKCGTFHSRETLEASSIEAARDVGLEMSARIGRPAMIYAFGPGNSFGAHIENVRSS